jgi:hypothetical protein
MIALGKIASPLTQKIERNLEQARFTIDLLGMLEAKTAGNRTEEESRALKTVLTELRLNYIDEMEKDRQAEQGQEAETGERFERNGRPVKDGETGKDEQAEKHDDEKKEA